MIREIVNVSAQIEKLKTDSTVLQNRQKETKAVLEEKQKEYQATDRTEKEKAETDFQKEKIDNLYAGVCRIAVIWSSSDKDPGSGNTVRENGKTV